MATAMNALGYDAAALGNHEYNYGLDTLRAFEDQCDHPLLVGELGRLGHRASRSSRRTCMKPIDLPGGRPVTVGILGLVTPGVAIWDAANVEGKVRFPGIVEQAEGHGAPDEGRRRRHRRRLVPLGVDHLVVVRRRAALPRERQPLLAEQVPDIDAILVGHAHVEVPELKVTNTVTGREVLLSEPLYWGMRVSGDGPGPGPRAARLAGQALGVDLLNANTVPEDAEIAALVRPAHEKVLTYVNSVIGTCTAGDVGVDLALPGHRGDGLHQPGAGADGQGGAGGHPAGGPAGAVDRRAVQQGCRDPGRRRDRARRGGAVHLRQHAARHHADRRAGQGLPRDVGGLLQAGQRHRAVPGIRRDQRGDADGAERHPRLQLRHHGRPRRRRSPTTSTSRVAAGVAHHEPARTPVRPSTRPRPSSSRSTTTGRAAAATSRTSRPRRWSTTARSRSAS